MRIVQLSTALPKSEYQTECLIEHFPCSLPDRVRQNVLNLGVSKRYLIDQPGSESVLCEEGLTDLCKEACTKAMENAGTAARDIDCFIVGYDANPFLSPGLGQLLVSEVGLNPYTSLVNVQGVASTAFPKALELAGNRLAAHPDGCVLLCISGVSSYWFQNQVRGLHDVMEIGQINEIKNPAKRLRELQKWVAIMEYFLFGDGVACAVVAGDGKGLEVKKIVEVTNVGKNDYLAGYARLGVTDEPFAFGFYSHLDRAIPELGAKYTGLALRKLLIGDMKTASERVKKWAVHTGSAKILDSLAKHHGIEREKLEESHAILDEYGNLSGASLPFILERIVSSNRLSQGDMIMMLGYGWGFSASAAVLECDE